MEFLFILTSTQNHGAFGRMLIHCNLHRHSQTMVCHPCELPHPLESFHPWKYSWTIETQKGNCLFLKFYVCFLFPLFFFLPKLHEKKYSNAICHQSRERHHFFRNRHVPTWANLLQNIDPLLQRDICLCIKHQFDSESSSNSDTPMRWLMNSQGW